MLADRCSSFIPFLLIFQAAGFHFGKVCNFGRSLYRGIEAKQSSAYQEWKEGDQTSQSNRIMKGCKGVVAILIMVLKITTSTANEEGLGRTPIEECIHFSSMAMVVVPSPNYSMGYSCLCRNNPPIDLQVVINDGSFSIIIFGPDLYDAFPLCCSSWNCYQTSSPQAYNPFEASLIQEAETDESTKICSSSWKVKIEGRLQYKHDTHGVLMTVPMHWLVLTTTSPSKQVRARLSCMVDKPTVENVNCRRKHFYRLPMFCGLNPLVETVVYLAHSNKAPDLLDPYVYTPDSYKPS